MQNKELMSRNSDLIPLQTLNIHSHSVQDNTNTSDVISLDCDPSSQHSQRVELGRFIKIGSMPGIVRYIGATSFASGIWIGIELALSRGKNNGTVRGVKVIKLI